MKFKQSSGRVIADKASKVNNRKTFFLGLLVVSLLVSIVFFGIPLLVRFSVFLGDRNNRDTISSNKDDLLPPLAPRIFVPFEATSSAALNVSGTAEIGTLVELVKDNVLLDTVNTNDDGDFVFENILLDEGLNIFSAVAVSPEGKRSELSKEVEVVFDESSPSLEMTNPSETELTVDFSDFDIKGKTEADASVLVNGRVAMVDGEGNFKLKLQLELGKNEIEVKAKDMAENETVIKIVITYDF